MSALKEVATPLDAAVLSSIDESALDAAFMRAYTSACERQPCFGHGTQGGAREWWRGVVADTFVTAGMPRSSLEQLLPDTFDLLWHRFCTRDGFRLLPHAAECLERLARWRASQPADSRTRVAVISNWDERLPLLLEDLGVAQYLDAVVVSGEVGHEKPDTQIFDLARQQLGVPADGARRCVHVGDSWSRDVRGATASGFEAVFVSPPGERAVPEAERAATPHLHLPHLQHLEELLGLQ